MMRRVQLVITDKCCGGGGLVLSLWHRKHSVRAHQREGVSCAAIVFGGLLLLQTWWLVDPWSFAPLEGVLPCVTEVVVRTLQRSFVHRRGGKLGETYEAATVKFQIWVSWWDLMIVVVLAGEVSSHKEWSATTDAIWRIIRIATTTEGALSDQDHGLHVILIYRLSSPCFHVLSC